MGYRAALGCHGMRLDVHPPLMAAHLRTCPRATFPLGAQAMLQLPITRAAQHPAPCLIPGAVLGVGLSPGSQARHAP